jgi:hypothetical protein
MPNSPKKSSPSRIEKATTHQHIIEVAAAMLRTTYKENFRIAELAEQASVGVPTVYYYFSSLDEIVAHAQIFNYVQLSVPVHSYDAQTAEAFATDDEDSFWEAMSGHMGSVWRAGGFDESLGVMRVLTDIWADEGAKKKLQSMISGRMAYWIDVVRTGQNKGWIAPEQDCEVLVKILWAASLGHIVLGEEFNLEADVARVQAFSVKALQRIGPVEPHND